MKRIKKTKSKKISVAVSKTNFNRVKSQTHLLTAVLRLEGHDVTTDRGVACIPNPDPTDEGLVPLSQIELRVRPRPERVIAKVVAEAEAAEAAAASA